MKKKFLALFASTTSVPSLAVMLGGGIFGVVTIAAVWGGITGSLPSQADLQAALDAKQNVPSTYNLGNASSYSVGPSSLLTGLVSYWNFDQASGNFTDSVGSSTLNKFSVVVPTHNVTGVVGKQVQFVALTATFAAVASNSTLNPIGSFTISGWMNATDVTGDNVLVSKYKSGSADYGYLLQTRTGAFLFRTADSTGAFNCSLTFGSIAINTNYYVAAGYDDLNHQLFGSVNGGARTTASCTGPLPGNTDDLSFGAIDGSNGGLSSNNLDGKMDEWGLWSRVLSTSEVTAAYNSGSGTTNPFTGISASTQIPIDLSLGTFFTLNLNADANFSGITNGTTGANYAFSITNTGSHVLSYDSSIYVNANTAPVIGTGASVKTRLNVLKVASSAYLLSSP